MKEVRISIEFWATLLNLFLFLLRIEIKKLKQTVIKLRIEFNAFLL